MIDIKSLYSNIRFSKVSLNAISNYCGQFWIALMGFVFVPYYLHYMGIEAYGLLGFCSSLVTVLSVLDLGLGSTVIREMARLSTSPGNGRQSRDLLRTLEVIYWSVAIVLAAIFLIISFRIPETWIKPTSISDYDVRQAIMIMGLVVACRWPFALYAGGLRGLQRQVPLNWIMGGAATMRGVGGVLVLWGISPTIQAFLLWQVLVDACQSILSAVYLWTLLPESEGPAAFSKEILRSIWRFSAGISGAVFLWVILSQMDKIVLSKILPLETFGYYCLGSVGAGIVIAFVAPLQTALYSRFVELVALSEESRLSDTYHLGCQAVTIMIMPASAVLVLFSRECLLVWTGDSITSANTYLILSILAAGTGIGGLLQLPYTLQISHGWTSFGVLMHGAFVVCMLPLLIVAAENYGAVGAASVWLFLNAAGFLIVGHIMHRRILKGQQWQWYIFDVGLPTSACLFIASLGRCFMPDTTARPALIIYLAVVMVLSMFAAAMASSRIRPLVMDSIGRIFGNRHSKHPV